MRMPNTAKCHVPLRLLQCGGLCGLSSLKTLTHAGILKQTKQGRERTYSLDRNRIASELRALAKKIETAQ